MKKLYQLLLTFVFCGLICTIIMGTASALVLTDAEVQEMCATQEMDITRASSYFAAYDWWASAVDDAEVEVGFNVTAPRVMNQLGATKIEILRKSGSNWISVETYKNTDSGMDYLYESDCARHTADVYFQGTAGKEYRAFITLKAEDDDGSEAKTVVTNIVQAHN